MPHIIEIVQFSEKFFIDVPIATHPLKYKGQKKTVLQTVEPYAFIYTNESFNLL